MPKYIFDITALGPYLKQHSQLSGIQRVSVMTIARARTQLGADHVWLGHHDPISDTYKVCPCPTDNSCDLNNYSTLCDFLHVRPSLRSLPGMKKYAQKPLQRRWHVWLRDMQAKRGKKKYFKRRGLSLEGWKAARAAMTSSVDHVSTNEPLALDHVACAGDRLILLDNAWNPKGLEPWLKHAGTTLNLQVYALLHDLIPFVTPQYVEADMCVRFHDWLARSTEYVTCYLANSENTGQDLRTFLNHQNASKTVQMIPLAQALLFDLSSKSRPEDRYIALTEGAGVPGYIRAITKTPYVLVVGTMEVRKNLWQLATVWDRLRMQSGRRLPKLVFAGRRGWLNDDFDALMTATGQLGGWAEVVEEPDDTALSYLYRNCLFTATVSFYEGWGLPIGESLAHGKTAVVSNTSSMPEVGGDMVEYCDPHSLDSIEAACLRLIDDPDHRAQLEERIANTRLRSWDDVAHDMLEAVRA